MVGTPKTVWVSATTGQQFKSACDFPYPSWEAWSLKCLNLTRNEWGDLRVTLSPTIMQVEKYPNLEDNAFWKLQGPIFHFHDYGFFELRFKVGIFQNSKDISCHPGTTELVPFSTPDLRGFTVKSREIQLLERFFENHQPMKLEMYEMKSFCKGKFKETNHVRRLQRCTK